MASFKLTDLNSNNKKTETTNFERMQKQLNVNVECENTLSSARVTHTFTHTSSKLWNTENRTAPSTFLPHPETTSV